VNINEEKFQTRDSGKIEEDSHYKITCRILPEEVW
jgi:hypothetical protein